MLLKPRSERTKARLVLKTCQSTVRHSESRMHSSFFRNIKRILTSENSPFVNRNRLTEVEDSMGILLEQNEGRV